VLHLEHSSFVWCWNMDTTEIDQKYRESYEMWRWRRMEEIIWTYRVEN
jgi:hypothetical protein